MLNNITVLILDDVFSMHIGDPLVLLLKEKYEDVVSIQSPAEGLKYIKENLQKNIIVLLDFKFGHNEPTGDMVLKSIKKESHLIPVIIWTANPPENEKFRDLINDHAFGFIDKADIIGTIGKIDEAAIVVNNSVDVALEEWILKHSDEERVSTKIFSIGGKEFSLNDLLREIRNQSKYGVEFEKKLIKLTIELLSRNKETI